MAAPRFSMPLGSAPAMVTAAWYASSGRRRLPPAKVEWRIAPWMEAGTASALGSSSSRARSVISAASLVSDFTSTGIVFILIETGWLHFASAFEREQCSEEKQSECANRTSGNDVGRRGPIRIEGDAPLLDLDGCQAVFARSGRRCDAVIERDAPCGVGAQAQDQVAGVRHVDVEVEMLGVGLHCGRRRGVDRLTALLLDPPVGIGALIVHDSERDAGIGNQAGVGQARRDYAIVRSHGLVFVDALKARAAFVNADHGRDGVFIVAGLEVIDGGDGCAGEKQSCAGGPDEDAWEPMGAGARRGGGGEEDRHWSFKNHQPAPWKLQELELGQEIPDGQRDGKLKKEHSNRD